LGCRLGLAPLSLLELTLDSCMSLVSSGFGRRVPCSLFGGSLYVLFRDAAGGVGGFSPCLQFDRQPRGCFAFTPRLFLGGQTRTFFRFASGFSLRSVRQILLGSVFDFGRRVNWCKLLSRSLRIDGRGRWRNGHDRAGHRRRVEYDGHDRRLAALGTGDRLP